MVGSSVNFFLWMKYINIAFNHWPFPEINWPLSGFNYIDISVFAKRINLMLFHTINNLSRYYSIHPSKRWNLIFKNKHFAFNVLFRNVPFHMSWVQNPRIPSLKSKVSFD